MQHRLSFVPADPQLLDDSLWLLVTHTVDYVFDRGSQELAERLLQTCNRDVWLGRRYAAQIRVNRPERIIKSHFGRFLRQSFDGPNSILRMPDTLADMQSFDLHRKIVAADAPKSTRFSVADSRRSAGERHR